MYLALGTCSFLQSSVHVAFLKMSLEALLGFCLHVLCDLSYVSIVTFGPRHVRVVIEVCRVFEQGTLLFQLEFQVGHNRVECKFAPVLQGALTGVHPDTHKHL